MAKLIRGTITSIIGVAVWVAVVIAAPAGGVGVTADQALQKLMAGNKRFVALQIKDRVPTMKEDRENLVYGQKPYAVILSCSDSRVPPEIVFDETLGQLFVVRVAGNIVDPVVLGSIEYAVEHLGPSLIMVLGHESCGAVTAAFDLQGKPEGNIGAILEAIAPAVQTVKETTKGKTRAEQVEAAIDANVALVAQNLTNRSPIIKDLVDRGKVKIVKAKYHLYLGEVTLFGQ